MSKHKFWMVYVAGTPGPSVRHVAKSSAEKEAERLLCEGPGRQIYVLEAIKRVAVDDPKGTWSDLVDPGPNHKTRTRLKRAYLRAARKAITHHTAVGYDDRFASTTFNA